MAKNRHRMAELRVIAGTTPPWVIYTRGDP